MNINLEAYKYKRSDAQRRTMWQLNDIIPIIYIICTHNFYTHGKPSISGLKLYVYAAKFCAVILKPWQFQLEINIETGIFFCHICADFVFVNFW